MESCETSEIEGNMWFLDEFKTYLNVKICSQSH